MPQNACRATRAASAGLTPHPRRQPASREVAPVRRRGRPQRPLRQGQGVLRSALAYARLGSLESRAPLARRLRAGPRRTVVAHEAAETFAPPHDAVGRADDREIGVPQGRDGGPWYAHARGAGGGRPNGKSPTRGNVAGFWRKVRNWRVRRRSGGRSIRRASTRRRFHDA